MTKTKNRELKNCPFCGGVAEVATYYEYGKARGKFVFCTKCSITQEHPYSSKQNAIDVWNRRYIEVDNRCKYYDNINMRCKGAKATPTCYCNGVKDKCTEYTKNKGD
jgi:Lar family restriction alleviation protein